MQSVRKLSTTDNRVRLVQDRKTSSARSSLDTVRYGGLPRTDISSAGLTVSKSSRVQEMFGPQERKNYTRVISTARTTSVRPPDEHNGLSPYHSQMQGALSHVENSSYVYNPKIKGQRSFDSEGPEKEVNLGVIDKYHTIPLKRSPSHTNVSVRLFDGSERSGSPDVHTGSLCSLTSSVASNRGIESGSLKHEIAGPVKIELSTNNGTCYSQKSRSPPQTSLPSSEKFQGSATSFSVNQPNGLCVINDPYRKLSYSGTTAAGAVKPPRIETSGQTTSPETSSMPSQCIQIQQTDNPIMSKSGAASLSERITPRAPIYYSAQPPPYSAAVADQNDTDRRPAVVVSYSSTNRDTITPQKSLEGPIGFDTPHRSPHVGLLNHGNTCYMSVIFQCLRFTPSLYTFCTSSAVTQKSGKLITGLSELFENMAKQASHQELYRNVEKIRTIMGGFSSLYSGSEQQDATEFLTCMLDMLHSEMKPSGNVAIANGCSNINCNNEYCSSTPPSSADSTPRYMDPGSSDSIGRDNLATARTLVEQDTSKCRTPSTFRRNLKRFIQKGGKRGFSTKKSASHECCGPPVFKECGTNADAGLHPAIRAWEEENKSEASNIRETFMSQLQTYRKCNQCSAEKLYFSVVWNLGVPIPRNAPANKPTGISVPISVVSNPLTKVDDGKRYGGSPSIPGQYNKVAKSINLFDGSNAQASTSPIIYPRQDPPFVQNDQCNTSTSGSPSSSYSNGIPTCSASISVPPPPPPIGAAPPPYSADARSTVTPVPLKDCLNAFMLTEVLDGTDRPMCATCKEKTACVLHHSISRLPDILIIQLLRFCCGERRQKIDVPVAFEKKLNMEDYIKSEYEKQHKFPSPTGNENDHIYWLYAVVYHDGAMSYGHYTAACRTATGSDPSTDQWYHFDDEFVKEIKSEDVHKSSAYLLFYERDNLYQQRKNTQMKPTPVKCIEGPGSQPTLRPYETRV